MRPGLSRIIEENEDLSRSQDLADFIENEKLVKQELGFVIAKGTFLLINLYPKYKTLNRNYVQGVQHHECQTVEGHLIYWSW